MTLNQVVSELNTIANNHLQIQTFGFGDVWELATSGDITYPVMWTTLEGVDISTPAKTEIYKFSLFFMDIVKNGEINETEVLSDQLSIAKDVLAQLKHPSYKWTFEDNVSSLEDFTERFTDSVAGWKMNVSLKLANISNRCVMPYSGNVSTNSACPDVTIYASNGTTILATIVAGGSYIVSACPSADCSGSYEIYIDGALNQSGTSLDFSTETFNISL